jgi:hypothetical protein
MVIEFFISLTNGNLYMVCGTQVYVIVDGLPFESSISADTILNSDNLEYNKVIPLRISNG